MLNMLIIKSPLMMPNSIRGAFKKKQQIIKPICLAKIVSEKMLHVIHGNEPCVSIWAYDVS